MNDKELQEKVLSAWIGLNGALKDSRMTKEMTYNEAIVMRVVLERYRLDGVGVTPIQQIIRETHMLKSLVNRTINSLCENGFLSKQRDSQDRRNLSVVPVAERLPDFLETHNRSLQIARNIIDIIGEEYAGYFVEICEKIAAAGLSIS